LDDFMCAARRLWHERGKRVRDAVPAVENTLTENDVVLLQVAEMIELKALERHLNAVERARATLVLVADAERLQAMGAVSPMQQLIARAP
jgi:ATP-dependent exoDNAse (exonuclease V) alpha subunit